MEVMERVYGKVFLGMVVPEMGVAMSRASACLDAEGVLKDLEVDLAPVDLGEVGLARVAFARRWFHRFAGVISVLTPDVVVPLRANFLGCMSRRVRSLELTDAQERVVLTLGAGCLATLRKLRANDVTLFGQGRSRDQAIVSSSPISQPPDRALVSGHRV